MRTFVVITEIKAGVVDLNLGFWFCTSVALQKSSYVVNDICKLLSSKNIKNKIAIQLVKSVKNPNSSQS